MIAANVGAGGVAAPAQAGVPPRGWGGPAPARHLSRLRDGVGHALTPSLRV
mgnify:CR=1 FL=1